MHTTYTNYSIHPEESLQCQQFPFSFDLTCLRLGSRSSSQTGWRWFSALDNSIVTTYANRFLYTIQKWVPKQILFICNLIYSFLIYSKLGGHAPPSWPRHWATVKMKGEIASCQWGSSKMLSGSMVLHSFLFNAQFNWLCLGCNLLFV